MKFRDSMIKNYKYVSVEVLGVGYCDDSYISYDSEIGVDMAMVYTKDLDNPQNVGMAIYDYSPNGLGSEYILSASRGFIGLEVLGLREACRIVPNLTFPPDEKIKKTQVRLSRISKKLYRQNTCLANHDYSTAYIRLCTSKKKSFISPCPNFVFEVNEDKVLSGIWLRNVYDDSHYIRYKKWMAGLTDGAGGTPALPVGSQHLSPWSTTASQILKPVQDDDSPLM